MAVVSVWGGEATVIVGLLFPIMLAALVITFARRKERQAITGSFLRLFFQYLITFVLVVLLASGLSGLMSQLLLRTSLLMISSGTMARNVSFVVVGLPLLVVMWRWLRRTFGEDRYSPVWTLYITAISLTSLLLVITGINDLILSLLRANSGVNRSSIAQSLVWAAVWGVHWALDRKTPVQHRSLHLLLGSLAGLVVSAIGLVTLLGGLLVRLFQGSLALLLDSYSPARTGAALLVAGVPAWIWYWLRTAYVRERDDAWNTYVLIAGVAGGLITTVMAASTALYKVLVWFLGDPTPPQASRFFVNTPLTVAAALVGLLIWWYHQEVLAEGNPGRTEIRRVYEYLISGIAVISIAIGITIVVMAAVEALTRSQEILTPSPINTLLLALTLFLVSIPIWLIFWRRISRAVEATPSVEQSSPTRRTYLFLLFGIGGVVALGALIAAVYILFQGVFDSRLGTGTFRRMRTPLGMLVSTSFIAAFHWNVFRSDAPHQQERAGLHYVLLLGPYEPDLVRAIRTEFGARVETRTTTGRLWDHEEVMALLRATDESSVVVVAGLRELVTLKA